MNTGIKKQTASEQPNGTGDSNHGISKEEQMRIINETGILKQIPITPKQEEPVLVQSVFLTIMLLFIFSALQIAYFAQFKEPIEFSLSSPGLRTLMARISTASVPFLFVVYFSHKYVDKSWMQFLIFVASILSGFKCMQLMGNNFTNMHQMRIAPGLGTLWAYGIIQLRLSLAVISLIIVLGAYGALRYYTGNASLNEFGF